MSCMYRLDPPEKFRPYLEKNQEEGNSPNPRQLYEHDA